MRRKVEYDTMTQALREAMQAAESLRSISLATGIHRASLRLFKAGKASLRLDLADELAKHFGLKVIKEAHHATQKR